MEKQRTLNRKLWKFLKVFLFLVYGIICLIEGIKLYHRFVQDVPIPKWSIYLFLSVAIMIPGLLGFAMKNKGAGTRFFVGTCRIVVSVALLLACILNQRGLEREPPQIALQTLQSLQTKAEDERLAFSESKEIKPAPVIDTTPPSFMECVMNGKKYYYNLPFDLVEKDVKTRCLKSVFAYGSDKQ